MKTIPQCEASADFIGNPEDVFIPGKNMNILERAVTLEMIAHFYLIINFRFEIWWSHLISWTRGRLHQ